MANARFCPSSRCLKYLPGRHLTACQDRQQDQYLQSSPALEAQDTCVHLSQMASVKGKTNPGRTEAEAQRPQPGQASHRVASTLPPGLSCRQGPWGLPQAPPAPRGTPPDPPRAPRPWGQQAATRAPRSRARACRTWGRSPSAAVAPTADIGHSGVGAVAQSPVSQEGSKKWPRMGHGGTRG